jgi:membrane protease YdiL (CAAX protease family)
MCSWSRSSWDSLYYKTKSLAFVTLLHGMQNFFLVSFLPFGYLQLF